MLLSGIAEQTAKVTRDIDSARMTQVAVEASHRFAGGGLCRGDLCDAWGGCEQFSGRSSALVIATRPTHLSLVRMKSSGIQERPLTLGRWSRNFNTVGDFALGHWNVVTMRNP
jgi:hypothetical protein